MAADDYDREICCHVTTLDKIEPEDDSICSRMFSIEVSASFMPQIDESTMEEDESELYDVDCDVVQKTFLVERHKLLSDETSSQTISEILASMNIPVDSFLIDRILGSVRQIGNNKHYKDRGVLYMKVEIELPPGFQVMDDDHDDDDEEEIDSCLDPASKESIDGLEKIKVKDSINCAICLDEFLMGLEATRMPCLHIFHNHCIVDWLHKSRACPLCRTETS